MDREQFRALQAPLKQRYIDDPKLASVTLRAEGQLGQNVTCSVATGRDIVESGLHPATGGTGLSACSGDILLQALVACAGVTLSAVATSLGIEVSGGIVIAEGDLDFRGTLGGCQRRFSGLHADPPSLLIADQSQSGRARQAPAVDGAVLRRLSDTSQRIGCFDGPLGTEQPVGKASRLTSGSGLQALQHSTTRPDLIKTISSADSPSAE
jgi:hypothetical protein